jgi:hypothetical protein
MRARLITNKKGSYIVETALTLPVFLISLIVLSSIILMYACIEDSNFILANTMRRSAVEAKYTDLSAFIPVEVRKIIKGSHSQVEAMYITDYIYRGNLGENDEVIALSMDMEMNSDNPLGLGSRAEYELSLATRAYVGRDREKDPMSEEEFKKSAQAVYVFPKSGEKYHTADCTFVRSGSTSVSLTDAVRRKYHSCPVCDSKNAVDGAIVFIFPNYGDSYHIAGCPTIERRYIEMDKTVAIDRGYTACSKCGG